MRIGYSFYGYLADVKMDEYYNEVSTPDGCATYAWSIIKELQNRGHEVFRLMQNNDKYAIGELGEESFSSFAKKERYLAYTNLIKKVPRDLDLVLMEWRWPIPGRNTSKDRHLENYQLDLEIQEMLLEKYKGKIIALDLDYKMTKKDISDSRIKKVFELGYKHIYEPKASHIFIPFDFRLINSLKFNEPDIDLIYIGNRYERDRNARRICVNHYGLNCSVCNFHFRDFYGELGTYFIHVHHLIPLSDLEEDYEIDPVEDLRPVCPNCHAMLHQRRDPLSIEDLREEIKTVGLEEPMPVKVKKKKKATTVNTDLIQTLSIFFCWYPFIILLRFALNKTS